MQAKEGDLVEVSTDNEVLKGRLIPGPDKTRIVLKLGSGYNISLDRKKIKKIKLIKKYQEKENAFPFIKTKKGLKTVTILHTGGTLASEVSYETGGVIPRYTPEELLGKFPEIADIVNVKSRLIRNMWSEDINFKHYNLLAKEIVKELRKVDGVIITHGTDTIGYTAAALSFILEGLEKPVLIVGAQRSSDRGSSDAAFNLTCAAKFIAESDFGEVAICMHESMSDDNCLIMPACKTRKLHSSRRDAFKVVNGKAFARVSKEKITFLRKNYGRIGKNHINIKLFKDVKVGILKAHPNMKVDEVRFYRNFDGLVLDGYGLAGNFPINKIDNFTLENEKIYAELKKLSKKMPLVATTQTIFGRVNMNVYSTGRKMQDIGILGNYSDMLTETAFIKLAWLLSNFKKEDVRSLIGENLRGEISKRITSEFLE